MGLRDFLREQRSRYPTQQDMLDYIEYKSGWRPSQAILSQWLSGARYPDRTSRQKLKSAFNISDQRWFKMLRTDAGDETRDASAGEQRTTAVA